ncbi:phosphoesterase [Nibricoccus aquaticus]|uniref:Phosphoesterase n=1 Tax=Nibricoccus aquaticus TaxID=2576891 RepID=A0A290QB89_9BACT|nr:phosphatase PAP2 family protein [Nibricoccus aquaticus]ATC65939.1 phosphoesterase [Nibricoccus aquaticus]
MIAHLKSLWRRSGWNEFVLTSAGLAFIVAVCGFVLLARAAPQGEYLELEEKLMLSLRQPDDVSRIIGPWWVQEVARDVSALGSAMTLILMTVLVLGYLLLRRGYAAAALVVVATLGGYGISGSLKNVFDRERPDVVPHLSHVTSESFPSGHSMLASVVYLTLGALLAQTAVRKREKIYFINVALFLAFIIGVSRVLLGVHYPTDVLAGWSAGTAWALLCWCATYWLQRRGTMRSDLVDEDGSAS